MLSNGHTRRGLTIGALLLISIFASQCAVYTVNKTDLEQKLRPRRDKCCDGKEVNSLLAMYRKQYNNRVDTLQCVDERGQVMAKKLTFDTKITVITKQNKIIKYYAKSLYIYDDKYLIGERTSPTLYGPNLFPVKLAEIEKIRVRKFGL